MKTAYRVFVKGGEFSLCADSPAHARERLEEAIRNITDEPDSSDPSTIKCFFISAGKVLRDPHRDAEE